MTDVTSAGIVARPEMRELVLIGVIPFAQGGGFDLLAPECLAHNAPCNSTRRLVPGGQLFQSERKTGQGGLKQVESRWRLRNACPYPFLMLLGQGLSRSNCPLKPFDQLAKVTCMRQRLGAAVRIAETT